MEELKKRRQQEIRVNKKKNQKFYAFIMSIIAIIIFIFLLRHNKIYSIFWFVGLLIGITLQRSRFCFAASFRDPIMVGSTSILKAIIIAFMVATIGFAIIQYYSIDSSGVIDVYRLPGQISPVGIHTAIGAILFGIGMVIAGGCASGTLMRIGEGFLLQIVVLIGFIIGTVLGAHDFEFWDKLIIRKSPTIYIPKYIGLPTAVILQIIFLTVLYFITDWYDKKNNLMSS
ncbi:transporter [Caloranaerobacter sp. TR13]|nr:transporter [Caloranaerobacter sp. TR13]